MPSVRSCRNAQPGPPGGGGTGPERAPLLVGWTDSSPEEDRADSSTRESSAATDPSTDSSRDIDGLFDIGDGRKLYVRCTGTSSPTVIIEGGDDDTTDSYAYAETAVSEVTRTCVYDRANLGRSDPDPGSRRLKELVGDLEGLIEAATIPGPYVLVGTSGGGYITHSDLRDAAIRSARRGTIRR